MIPTQSNNPIPRRLMIFHPIHFENWGPRTPDERGIGNSETAQIELGKAFARRGWEVYSFAPLPDGDEGLHDGVYWLPLEKAQSNVPGHWMIFRAPEALDKFALEHPEQKLYIVSQDESLRGRWTPERIAKVDCVFALCQAHRDSLESDDPGLKGKVFLSSNGIKLNLIREIEREPAPVRDPHRMLWASSPDRGLLRLLRIFRRLREWVSDATLAVTYSFDNIDKLLQMGPQFAHFQGYKDAVLKEAAQPGVEWLGRLPQPVLYREWLKTGLLVYPTTFRETSCATLMEAQALGAVPLVSPVWALGENLCGGAFIQGDPEDPLVSARFVGEIYRLMSNPKLQEAIRVPMMADARMRFSWDRQVDCYESLLLGFGDHPGMKHAQFNFQIKQCLGAESILQVGCADDPANLKALGAFNIDARAADPIFGKPTKADLIADVRDLPLNGCRYSHVVCGDMLEHFPIEAVPDILKKLRACLAPGGKLVLTIPDDHRPPNEQHAGSDGSQLYSDGVSACHLHRVPLSLVETWLESAGLQMVEYQETDCGHYLNHCLTAIPLRRVTDDLDAIDQILAEAE